MDYRFRKQIPPPNVLNLREVVLVTHCSNNARYLKSPLTFSVCGLGHRHIKYTNGIPNVHLLTISPNTHF